MLVGLGPLVTMHLAAALADGPPRVALTLYDQNHDETVRVTVGVDGATSPADAATLQRVLRCKRTERQHVIAPGTLAMLAQVGLRHPGKTIELVSGYRAAAKESATSKHRAGSAIDFRIPGVVTSELRDELWRRHRGGVGLGWYPASAEGEAFVHLDHRPGEAEMTWTFSGGTNHYHPSWARRAREVAPTRARGKRPTS